MTKIEIILLIICVALLVVVGYAVPWLIQMRKTAARAADTLGSINQRLPAIMTNLEEITTNMNRVAKTAGRQVEDLALTVEKINGVMNFYLEKELVFRQRVSIPIANTFRTYGAVIKGVLVFLDSLKTGSKSLKNNRST